MTSGYLRCVKGSAVEAQSRAAALLGLLQGTSGPGQYALHCWLTVSNLFFIVELSYDIVELPPCPSHLTLAYQVCCLSLFLLYPNYTVSTWIWENLGIG